MVESLGGGLLGPVALVLLLYPAFVGRRIVYESNSGIRNVVVPIAVVADEGCPCLAAQDFVELNPRGLQFAQPLGGSRYSLISDSLTLPLFGNPAVSLRRPVVLRPRLTTGLPFRSALICAY